MDKVLALKVGLGFLLGGIIGYTSNFIKKQINFINQSKFQFSGAKITQLSLRKITIRLDWELDNKSSLSAYINNQEYDVFLNDVLIKKISYSSLVKINAKSETTIPTYVSLEPDDFKGLDLINIAKFFTTEGRKSLVLKVVGNLDVKLEFINIKKYPIRYEDTIENIYKQ